MDLITNYHKPVLLKEVVSAAGLAHLNTQADFRIVDATLGAGGYTLEFVKSGARVLAFETDSQMLELARARLNMVPQSSEPLSRPFNLVHQNFRNIAKTVASEGFLPVDCVVFDLGVASEQLISPSKGLSFGYPDALLDMRLDPSSQGVKASDLLNALDKNQLMSLFGEVLDYPQAKRLTDKVVKTRETHKFFKTKDFLDLLPGSVRAKKGINLATVPLMALRMAVNSELDNLSLALKDSIGILKPKGRILVVSFHSSEDRVVKKLFVEFEGKGFGRIVTKKPIQPSDREVKDNPRSRSAKLRVFEKI